VVANPTHQTRVDYIRKIVKRHMYVDLQAQFEMYLQLRLKAWLTVQVLLLVGQKMDWIRYVISLQEG
jgi:hypothetical protein